MAAARAAVAKMHGDAVVGMSHDREDSAANGAAPVPELDHVADDLPVFAALKRCHAGGLQTFGSRRAHDDGVVPCQPGDRFGQLLQPAVIGEATVEDGWIV